MIVLYSGINLQRSPFQALLADLVPSRYRSLATGSVTFQMCVGAIVFLMLGRMLGMRPAFLVASGAVLAIAAVFALGLREPAVSEPHAAEVTFRSLLDAAWSAIRGAVPGMRAVFLASLLLQLTFQSFTTWYALHGTERFGVSAGGRDRRLHRLGHGRSDRRIARWYHRRAHRPAECDAARVRADGGLPARAPPRHGGSRRPRRSLPLASAGWTLPMVNAYPLFVEPIPRRARGVLAALFLLCMALGGAIGDPLNGGLFDLFGGYRPLFLIMTGYTALAFVAVLFVPRGAGEADTGVAPHRPERSSACDACAAASAASCPIHRSRGNERGIA